MGKRKGEDLGLAHHHLTTWQEKLPSCLVGDAQAVPGTKWWLCGLRVHPGGGDVLPERWSRYSKSPGERGQAVPMMTVELAVQIENKRPRPAPL
jgi:hypothetical protein